MCAGKHRAGLLAAGLLLAGMLPSAAQEGALRMHYLEIVRSDYGSAMSLGRGSAVRADTTIQDATLYFRFRNDSELLIQVRPLPSKAARNTSAADASFAGYLALDATGRVRQVRSSAEDLARFANALGWLEELHFRCPPAAGETFEKRRDGNYRLQYDLAREASAAVLRKTDPGAGFPNHRQALVWDHYSGTARFERNVLRGLKLSEAKRQYIGRRALACIRRELLLEPVPANESGVWPAAENWVTWQPFQPVTEAERRRRIAVNLLGQTNYDELATALLTVDSLNGEERFRLKSKWRSLLLVDTSTVQRSTALFGAASQGAQALLEDALIESSLPEANRWLVGRIEAARGNYAQLRNLLMKISLAGNTDSLVAMGLLALLDAPDENTKRLAALTVANMAHSAHASHPQLSAQLQTRLMDSWAGGISDTLHFLNVTGNAGIAETVPQVLPMLATEYRGEALMALRFISGRQADSVLLHEVMVADSLPEAFFNNLLAARSLPASWVKEVVQRIIRADERGTSSWLPALRFLLDAAYREGIPTEGLLGHRWKLAAYAAEIADFIKAGALCRAEERPR